MRASATPSEAVVARADLAVRPLPRPLVWSLIVCASAFIAFVGLPAAFIFSDPLRPGGASLRVRFSLIEMLLRGLRHPMGWVDDSARMIAAAAGLAAGLAAVVLAAIILVALARRGRGAWPKATTTARGPYVVAVSAFGLAGLAVTAAAFVVPVPARPMEWWLLTTALACATSWVAGRRSLAWGPAAVMGALVAVAIAVDVVVSRGACLVLPGGWQEVVGGLAALTGALAAGAGWFHERPVLWNAGVVLAVAAAAVFGVALVLGSAGPLWADPRRVFPPAGPGARAVVVVPHIDDEAAFAGETIAWLASHGYRVTIVVATDSRGGRALDKDRVYRARRDEALAASVRDLGAAEALVFEDVRDGARMSTAAMERAIFRDLEASGLLAPGTVLVTVSGTGHPNHVATFAAVRRAAASAGLRLFVAWGYDAGHDLISRPSTGVPAAFDGGPLAVAAKAGATERYIALYEDHYAFTLPRAIVLGRGAHDVLSVLPATDATVAP